MNLYVGNFPFNTTEEDLNNAFSQFGTVVKVNIVKDRDRGTSKGFGFVEMSSDSEGEAAVAGLNGKDFNGRTLKVNEAHAQGERRGGGGFRRDR
jgi:RNA recognition motif-containing protein